MEPGDQRTPRLDWSALRAWVTEAGQIALSHWGSATSERKADESHVTAADLEVEAFLRSRLATAFPETGYLGEEEGGENLDRDWVWSIDPVDGTTNFVRGLPLWAVSAGLLYRWQPWAGIVYLPLTGEVFWGGVGQGAYLGDRPIAPDRDTQPDRMALWAVGAHVLRHHRLELDGVTRCLGSAAAHLVYTACGSVKASLYQDVHLWDFAGGLAVAQAAGCTAVTLDGRPFSLAGLTDGRGNPDPAIVAAPQVARLVAARLTPLTRSR